jgi:hypothetical protein
MVGHRQGSGVSQTDGADKGIGFCAVHIGTRTEHLAFCFDLNVDFQTDNGFVFHKKNSRDKICFSNMLSL